MAPLVKGLEHTEPGGHALAGMSESDSNPNKRHTPSEQAYVDSNEEAKPKEILTSRLIDRNPISSETQAALLALLSEPFTEQGGGNSFAELVEAPNKKTGFIRGPGGIFISAIPIWLWDRDCLVRV